MREGRDFQTPLIREIRDRFPHAFVLKNDANYLQGIPDLTIILGEKWAMLECKKSADEPYQPNQEYYIDRLDEWGFCRTIHPGNKDSVMLDLEDYFFTDELAK